MKKLELGDIKIKRGLEKTDNCYIFEMDNGEILKVYDDNLLFILDLIDLDIEKRILDSKEINNVKEIIVPNGAVYNNNSFVGYTMPKAKGVDYNEKERSLSLEDRENLKQYVFWHLKLEDIIRRANKENVVFPDLLTCDNIFFHDNNFSFIDYDGIQINDNKVLSISSSLGNPAQYYNKKYMKEMEIFTDELDKKSLIVLFFLTAFNINLANVGEINPYTGEVITLDQIFQILGLEDYDIMNKVWKLFSLKDKNEFLDKDLYRLIDNYDLRVIGKVSGSDCYVKKLFKK
ncbi:MAG: hypothetical protein VZS44_01095 [Bacilli bacterium]|nr:hypothetical protein [Bacilli bacterium]